MRKIYSLCLMLFALCNAAGAQTTIDFTELSVTPVAGDDKTQDGFTLTEGAYTFVAVKNNGSSAPTQNGTAKDIRTYAKNTITVSTSGAGMAKLVFNISAAGLKRQAELTPSTGTVAVDMDAKTVTWTGEATQTVSFTVGDKAVYGTDGNTKAGQFNSNSVEITTAGESTKTAAGLKFSQSAFELTLGDSFTEPTLTKDTDADAVYSSSNTDVATVDAATGKVQILAAGSVIITAKTAENATYYEGSAAYTIKVNAPVLTEVNLPYAENFKEGIGSFTIDNRDELPEGVSYVWKENSTYGMTASAYVNKTNYALESWLVSPLINMTNATDATLNFTQVISKFFGDVSQEATLWVQEEGGQWQQVQITYPVEFPTGKNFTAATPTEVSLTQFAGKKVKVGFCYHSTEQHAGTWQISAFSVSGTTGIQHVENAQQATDGRLYNLAGQRVGESYKGMVIQNGRKFIKK